MKDKKTVAIISFHYSVNCGAVLQTFALQKYINSLSTHGGMGINTLVIDYRPCLVGKKTLSFRVRKSPIKDVLKDILTGPFKLVRQLPQKRAVERFIHTNMNLTNYYSRSKQLKKVPPVADVYITGSDQVWNPQIFGRLDSSYLLGFVKEGIKISYAASFGMDAIDDKCLDAVAIAARGFDAASVREHVAVQALKNVGVLASLCIDPVFLIDKESFLEIASPVACGDYVLVYAGSGSRDCYREAARIALLRGLMVVGCGNSSSNTRKTDCDMFVKDCSPDMLIGLIANAAVVVSNSFHGCALAIVFEKDFVIYKNATRNSRVHSLLMLSGLEDRFLDANQQMCDENIYKNIDYGAVWERLSPVIEQSKRFLKENLR